MQRTLSIFVAIVLIAIAGYQRDQVYAQTITYSPGWNLISGPEGSTLVGAEGNMYALQPGDTTYETFPATTQLRGGWGYWAYFPAGGSLRAGAGSTSYSVSLNPDEWTMVGNPSTTTAVRISGATSILGYSPTAGYSAEDTIPVGQGAWVQAQGAISLDPATGDSSTGALRTLRSTQGYEIQIPNDWILSESGGNTNSASATFFSPDKRAAVNIAVSPRSAGSDVADELNRILSLRQQADPSFTVTTPPASTSVPGATMAFTASGTSVVSGALPITSYTVAGTNTHIYTLTVSEDNGYTALLPTGFTLVGS